ncbi:MAG: aminoglycoside 3'-phosphotransferase [Actinomycetota bacterium]|nr:aminoglycoside 3'-phosphotransferase [Actinomycetota bacterium]MDA8208981.1 aminoglycoside 3'-phosphotransferase [Actinomycetota bacterium]
MSLPRDLADLLGAGRSRLVWRNEAGGLTFEVAAAPRAIFLKWVPASSGIDLVKERERLAWAASFISVPRIVGFGEGPDGAWLATEAIDGDSAVSPANLDRPELAVRAMGEGLRRLHDALPVDGCPFDWSAGARLAQAETLHSEGRLDPSDWHVEHRVLTPQEALARLRNIPAVDTAVVCHGDACAPNTLLDGAGGFRAHVDLGSLGVADRWADLAVATWSTIWNFGEGYEDALLDAYGIDPDRERTAYYRLLWDCAD